jgi:Fe-S oxidoreductase
VTAVYDPADPRYLDPTEVRAELDRVFDLCQGCRLCFNLCPSFPSLFEAIDRHDGQIAELSDGERDQVVELCYQCKLCYLKCPYVPPHEWALDFPRLMARVHASRRRSGVGARQRMTDEVLGRVDRTGRVGTAAAPLVNRLTRPGSAVRRLMERTTGVAAQRLLPPYARQRFSTWFARHEAAHGAVGARATVSVYPTCFIEYMAPAIGTDLVGVLEHNDVACSLPVGTRCCGASWLHSGNIDRFAAAARRNVAALGREVRAGRDVVVAQPTCAYVIKRDYPVHVPGDDADLVAAHTFDPAEYLMRRHRTEGTPLKLDFPGRRSGDVPGRVTYHVPCHLRAQNIGVRSRDLLELAGIGCDLVERCSGIDGTWGYRAENYELARQVAQPLARQVVGAGNEVVCGDCHLANGAIQQETGIHPVHPIQVVARAYGLAVRGG